MAEALIVVDVQNDFLPGGALGVPGGFGVIEPILALAGRFGDRIAKTRDAHPYETDHFDAWPRHCVDGSEGAELVAAVKNLYGSVFPKGTRPGEDGYSGFSNAALEGWLREQGVTDVTVVGLALDYCVEATALDAARLGFNVTVPLRATAPVDPATGAAAVLKMQEAGVLVVP